MYLARVLGRLVSTVKQDTLHGVPLQWVQPLTAQGAPTGKPIVALDRVGVGPGEVVVYITSREAAIESLRIITDQLDVMHEKSPVSAPRIGPESRHAK